MFASPDTPGMPQASDKTAWDFLPDGWSNEIGGTGILPVRSLDAQDCSKDSHGQDAGATITVTDARGITRRVTYPREFQPITQLEHARLGIITPEMKRVAQHETHLTAEQVRDEIAAGRLIIPANTVHLSYKLDANVHRPGEQNQDQRQHGRFAGFLFDR